MPRRAQLFVSILLLSASGCSHHAGDSADPVPTATASAVPLALPGKPTAAQMCSDPTTYASIKDMVFNQAVEASAGDAVPLNDLRRASTVRMDFPLVQGSDASLGRAECSGRVMIDLPSAATAAFGGIQELKADVTYSIQPAADGRGNVITANGIAQIVADIEAANVLRAQRSIATQGGPQPVKTYNPSFDCGAKLSNSERMICQDETLAAKDRQLSDQFKAKLAEATADERQQLLHDDRAALVERAHCPDIACLNDWYDRVLTQ